MRSTQLDLALQLISVKTAFKKIFQPLNSQTYKSAYFIFLIFSLLKNINHTTIWKKECLPAPSLLAGLRLKSTRSKDWDSWDKNWGMPSLAFRIWVMVSLRLAPWNGRDPVSISNWQQKNQINLIWIQQRFNCYIMKILR